MSQMSQLGIVAGASVAFEDAKDSMLSVLLAQAQTH